MATTSKGIYYPNDYSAAANVPADMKKMAQSVDEVMGDSEAETKGEIQTLKTRMTSAENKNTQQDTALSNKVDKVQGKGLSTNDYTNTEKAQVATNKRDIATIKQEQTTQNTNIQTNATNIEALEEECERLRDDLANTTASVEGEGESITLNNTANARFKKFAIEGNSKQTQLSGKNLLNYNQVDFSSLETTWYFLNGAKGAYGSNIGEKTDIKVPVTEGKTYSISFTNLQNVSTFQLVYEDETIIRNNIDTSPYIFTATRNGYAILRVRVAEGKNAKISNIQLEEGSATDFEPYCGGTPSPNTEYEQPVRSCGDDVNLFDKDNANIVNGYIVSERMRLGTGDTNRMFYIPCKANTTYTISRSIITGSFRVATYDSTPFPTMTSTNVDYTISGYIAKNADTKITIMTGANAKFLIVHYGNTVDTNLQDSLDSIKIQEGEVATPWSPYGMGSITEKIVNKNLCLISSISTKGGGYINRSAGTFGNVVKGKTYTFSFINNSNYTSLMMIRIYHDNTYTEQITGNLIANKRNTYTFTASDHGVLAMNGKVAEDVSNIFTNIQLEEGPATDYVPHAEQTYSIPTQEPMRSIGDVRDGFVKKSGKKHEKHDIKRIVFTGTETWQTDVIESSGIRRFTNLNLPDLGYQSTTTIDSLCNRFKATNDANYTLYDNVSILRYVSNRNRIDIMCNKFNTVNEFKAWLKSLYDAGKPMYVDYVSGQPTELPCTPEQEAILNKIEQEAKTYEGVTHIFSEDEVPAYVEVEAYKDRDVEIQKLTNAIVALGGVV